MTFEEYFKNICASDWIQCKFSTLNQLENSSLNESQNHHQNNGNYFSGISGNNFSGISHQNSLPLSSGNLSSMPLSGQDQSLPNPGQHHQDPPHPPTQAKDQDQLKFSISLACSRFTLFKSVGSMSLSTGADLKLHLENLDLIIDRNLTKYHVYPDRVALYSEIHCMRLDLVPLLDDDQDDTRRLEMEEIKKIVSDWKSIPPNTLNTGPSNLPDNLHRKQEMQNLTKETDRLVLDAKLWTTLMNQISKLHTQAPVSKDTSSINQLFKCFQALLNNRQENHSDSSDGHQWSQAAMTKSLLTMISRQQIPNLNNPAARDCFQEMAEVFKESSLVYCADQGVLDVDELIRIENQVVEAHLKDINTLYL